MNNCCDSYGNANVAAFLPLYGGNISANVITGTLANGLQPNITVVGPLTGVTTTGNILGAGNLVVTSDITTTLGNVNVPAGSIFVNNTVVANGIIFSSSNIVTDTTIVAFDADIGNRVLANSIWSDNFYSANGQPYLPTYSGNISADTVSALGNIIGGNLLTGGYLSVGGNIYANNISASGNITIGANGYFVGNGSQLTGIVANLSGNLSGNILANGFYIKDLTQLSVNGNVLANAVSTTGNIASNAWVRAANGVATGNVVNATGNVAITANAQTWQFDTAGTLTLPLGTTVNETPAGLTVTLDQLTAATTWTGTLVFSQMSATQYQALPAGPTMDLDTGTGIWTINSGADVYYGSTDLITWTQGPQGTLPEPVGTISTAKTNLTNNSQTWQFDSAGVLTAPGNIAIGNNYFLGNGRFLTGLSTALGGNLTSNILANGFFINNLTGLSVNGNIRANAAVFANTYMGNTAGNLILRPVSANVEALDIYVDSNLAVHLAANTSNVIIGTDSAANVAVNNNGRVTVQANAVANGQAKTWVFDTQGGLSWPLTSRINETPRAVRLNGTQTNSTMNIVYVQAQNGNYYSGGYNVTTNAWWMEFDTNTYYLTYNGSRYMNSTDLVVWNLGPVTDPNIETASTGQEYSPAINIETQGNVWRFGGDATLITPGNVVVGGAVLGQSLSVSGNVQGNNLITVNITGSGNVVMAGNITGNNLSISNAFTGNSASLSGNVTATYYFGDGSQLTGIAPTVQVYEFANVSANINGYFNAVWLANYTAGNIANASSVATTTPVNVVSFITQSGYPGITVIPTGAILTRIETIKNSGPQGYHVYSEIYRRSDIGAETLVARSDDSTTITQNTTVQQNLVAYITQPVTLAATDRIVTKIYAYMDSGTATITAKFDNNTGSGLQLPALPASASQFVPYNNATANVNLGAFGLSARGNIYGGNLSTFYGTTTTGNVTTDLFGNIAGNVISAQGNVYASLFSASGNVIAGNITTFYGTTTTGNVTTDLFGNIAGNVISAQGNVYGLGISAIGNIYGGNLSTFLGTSLNGNVTVSLWGNIDAGNGYVFGNGALLTGIRSDSISNGTSNIGIFTANGNILMSVANTANVVSISNTTVSLSGNIITTGNANIGNITTFYGTTTTGNVTTALYGNITGNVVSAQGNVYAVEISASGNIVGGNLSTFYGTTTTGNVTTSMFGNIAGNVISAQGNVYGLGISAQGNVIAGNITTFYGTTTTGNVTTSMFGNIAGNVISAQGNIYGNNISVSGTLSVASLTGTNLSLSGNITAADIVLNYANTLSYPANAIINNSGTLYRASGNVAANTAFALGNVANTWTYVKTWSKPATSYWIDPLNGDDSNDGSSSTPIKTFAKLLTFANLNSGCSINLLPGVYSESVTWTQNNVNFNGMGTVGGLVSLTGNWIFNNAVGSVRWNGVAFSGTVDITGAAGVYFDTTNFNQAITKSGAGYVEISNSNITSTVSMTGAGQVYLRNVLYGAITVNNAGAFLSIGGGSSVGGQIAVTSGTVYTTSTNLVGANNTTPVLTLAAGTTAVMRDTMITYADGTVGNITVGTGALYSFQGLTYNRTTSTNTGTNLAQTFQVDTLYSVGNISSAGQVSALAVSATGNVNAGNISVSGNITTKNMSTFYGTSTTGNVTTSLWGNVNAGNGYVLGNGALLTSIPGGTFIANGTSNIGFAAANGNILMSVANTANVVLISNTTVSLSGNIITTANARIGNISTFLGTSLSGNVTVSLWGNVNVGNGYVLGNGSLLSGIPGGTFIANGTSNIGFAEANGNILMSVANTANVVSISNTTVSLSGNILTTANANIGNITTFYGTTTTGNVTTSLYGNITTGNINIVGNISIGGAVVGGLPGIANGTSNIGFANANGAITMNVNGTKAGNIGVSSISLGYQSATTLQGTSAVAIGQTSGYSAQGNTAVAVGYIAGYDSQGATSVAVGQASGYVTQGVAAVALGSSAGFSVQGAQAVALGAQAGQSNQSCGAVAVGWSAGTLSQNANAVAVGYQAGASSQGLQSIAIGSQTARNTQGSQAVAIGYQTAINNQGTGAIAIGQGTASGNQGLNAIAIGKSAALSNQGANAIAIGVNSGDNSGINSVAIGYNIGGFVGANSVAIGANIATAVGNVIAINGTGVALNANVANALFISPVRYANTVGNVVYYDSATREMYYGNVSNGIQNGTSNVAIATANGAVTISANSVANVVSVGANLVTFGANTQVAYGNVSNVVTANATQAYYPLVLDSTGVVSKQPTIATLSPVIDNTLTTPPTSPAINDAYLIPATGATGAWAGQGNKIATWTGSVWSFYTPVTNDQTSVLSGTNAGNVYLYTGTAWTLQTVNTGVPIYNWALASSYAVGTVVLYQSALYQANGAIPANTPFATGTTGATWKSISGSTSLGEFGNVQVPLNTTIAVGTLGSPARIANVTIPSSGTWTISPSIRFSATNVNGYGGVGLYYNSNNVSVGNSVTIGVYGGVGAQATASAAWQVSTSGATAYYIGAYGSSASVNSDVNGYSQVSYTKISGFLPMTSGVYTSATIPSAATSGMGTRAYVTDATSTTFNAAYVGGSTNKVPVVSNGTAWFIG